MAGASLGAGEWLIGPAVTARYGSALLWITLLTLLAQYIYNIEASRYTLATGEGIMTGKLRLKPGSRFWTFTYLAIDFWTMLPFQLSAVAVTAAAVMLGRIPDPATETGLMRQVTFVLLLLVPVPLIFGGTIYRFIKGLVMAKVFFVLGLLIVLGVTLASWRTVAEALLGFVQFGSLPAADGKVVNIFVALWRGEALPALDVESMKLFTTLAGIAGVGGLTQTAISAYTREQGWGMGRKVGAIPSMVGGQPVVTGRAKPASAGRVKTSHFERLVYAVGEDRFAGRCDEPTQSEHPTIDYCPRGPRLVAAPDFPGAGAGSRDRGALREAGGGKTSHQPGHRLGGRAAAKTSHEPRPRLRGGRRTAGKTSHEPGHRLRGWSGCKTSQ
jgi:hypothetical protein